MVMSMFDTIRFSRGRSASSGCGWLADGTPAGPALAGSLTTFDNSFTDRLGLSALATTDISYLVPLLLSDAP